MLHPRCAMGVIDGQGSNVYELLLSLGLEDLLKNPYKDSHQHRWKNLLSLEAMN